ncbi:MAG: hypothetical protein JWQ11_1083 [Rhizobacter sp.]|nr:hypothetical protein [Rhizobacter sp.]
MHRFITFFLIGLLATGVIKAAIAGDIVVIVNPGAAVPNKAQVADVFLGKSQSYVPLDQGDASPLRSEFYRLATGRDLAQVKSAWSRIVFTGKGQPPRELPDAAAVKRAVSADLKAIGYIDRSDLDASVKAALALN